MDSNETVSWLRADRLEESKKQTKRKLKGIKWITITIKVPICPKCNNPMQHELDSDARLLWKWVCPKCRHLI